MGEAGDPPANEIYDLSEKCGDNALLNGKGNFEPSPHPLDLNPGSTPSLDILTAPVATVIALLASGQIPRERIPSLLAERPDVAEAWSSDQRGGGASGWQPIETAPKDGSRVLVALWAYDDSAKGRFYTVAGWHAQDGADYERDGWYECEGCSALHDPTHWQQIDAPPATLPGGQP